MAPLEQKNYELFPPGRESRFEPTLSELCNLIDERRMDLLQEHGGVDGLVKVLETDPVSGLPQSEIDQEFADRKTQYGVNYIAPAKTKGFIRLWLEALKDTTIIILICAAIISLAIGIYQRKEDPYAWIDGVAIFVAIFIVATVTAVNDFSQEKQFKKLNEQKVNRIVKVIRAGQPMEISVHDIVVGDLCVVETGDAFPADGLYINGFNAAADESAMTGETDMIKKNPGSPFILSGTNLVEGQLQMIATGVGPNSQWGVILQKLSTKEGQTPLQVKLDAIVKIVSFVGIGAGILIFIALVVNWVIAEKKIPEEDWPTLGKPFAGWHFKSWLDFFIIVITVVVVAIPEGLPLAVTISLAFSMKRMLKDKNFVRKLAACETMGGCEAICSDKTGTLTKNQMTVVRMLAGDTLHNVEADMGKMTGMRSVDGIPSMMRDLIIANSAVNSTANLLQADDHEEKDEDDMDTADMKMPFVSGSKTEGALLILAGVMGADYTPIRAHMPVVDKINFSSARKRMTSIVDLRKTEWSLVGVGPNGNMREILTESHAYNPDKPYRIFTKGASEIVLGLCTKAMDSTGNIIPLTDEFRAQISRTISDFASQSLRTIVLAYGETDEATVTEALADEGEDGEPIDPTEVPKKDRLYEHDLVFSGLVGIKDPLRPGVKEAIARCHHAGIVVRMITGDNIQTGCAIAKECGIYDPEMGHKAVEGPVFRAMSDEEIDELIPDLRVMARSSPSDKHRIVERIKLHFHKVVAVTGDGTNDAPALSVADVGLAMGIAGTEVAREASDIVIMDDNFKSIVRAVEWGRTVMANIRKFLQFQLTVNIVALTATLVGSIANGISPFNSVELLYVNLIMDSLGSLALATEGPTHNVLDSKPVGRNEFLLTPKMIRNLVIQSVWQLIVVLVILFAGKTIFKVSGDGVWDSAKYENRFSSKKEYEIMYVDSILYNAFIWCQIFNEFNSRRIGDELNIFDNLQNCPIFWAVIVVTIILHVVLFQWAGIVLSTVPIGWVEYITGLGLGLLSWVWALIGRFIPVGERIILKPKESKESKKARKKAKKEAKKGIQSDGKVSVRVSDETRDTLSTDTDQVQ